MPLRAGSSYGMKTMPLSVDNIILLKEKEGLRESIGRFIRSPGSSMRRRKESGALKEEISVWNSQGGEKEKLFFSTFLSLSKDYITTMYPVDDKFSPF